MIAVAGLLLLGPGLATAPAQAIEAEELRSRIVEAISIYNAAAGAGPAVGDFYHYEDLTVEPQGADFRVTVTGLSILLDPVESGRLKAGDIAFSMTPETPDQDTGDDDLFRVFDLDMPSIMTATRGAAAPDLQVKLGAMRLDALWSFAYLTYLNLDTRIQDLEVVDPADRSTVSLPEATGEIRSLRKDGGVFDMTFDFRISGLQMEDPGFDARIAGLDTLAEISDYDLSAMAEIYRDLHESAATASPEERLHGVFGMMLAPESLMGSSSRMRVNARGLSFADLESGKTVELESLGLGLGLADLDQPLARAEVFLEQRGWRQNGVAGKGGLLESELLPQQAALKVTLEKLPFRQIMTEIGTAVGDPEAVQRLLDPQPGAPPEASGQLGTVLDPVTEKIRQAFLQAGTTINITDTGFQSQAVELELGGVFAADPAAVFGISGSLAAALFGLDRLVELAQAAMGDPDPEIRTGAMQAIGMLGALQAYAARGESDDGRPVDRFDVVVDPSGAITINGQPLMPAAPPPQPVE